MFLNCHTYHSLQYGLLSPERLVGLAAAYGIHALALTDINNSACAVEFHRLCGEAGIRASIGIEFRQDGQLLYIALAQSHEGLHAIHQLLNVMSVHRDPLPVRPQLKDCFILYSRLPCPIHLLFANEYQLVQAREIYAQSASVDGTISRLKQVAWHPITMHHPGQHEVHRLLRSMDEKVLFGHALKGQLAAVQDHIISPQDMQAKYRSAPWMITNAQRLLAEAYFSLACGPAVNRPHFGASRREDMAQLRALAAEGRTIRYAAHHPTAHMRLCAELDLIEKLDLQSYFLTTWDIVRYARQRQFCYVGRGSGANSVVAYCLFITDVDPIELNLYFERFVNPHREQPPDFDIDFSHLDRDEIWQYVFDRYSSEHAAVLGTYQRFKGRSLVRKIGSALGLSKSEQDTIVREPMSDAKHHPFAKKIFSIGHQLRKHPSHLSMHVGGIIIGHRPLSYTSALQQMPKGVAVTMMDMHHASAWGFHKFDLLSQRGLSHVRVALKLVGESGTPHPDIRDMAHIKQDTKVKELLNSSSCVGCFYIESPAMRGLLAKLRCDTYEQLIAACSIIRPGVAKSGMMQRYIESHLGRPVKKHLHPLFMEHLPDTFGIMVYQEDVMKMVHLFAGFDMHEADLLRRLMTGKTKSEGDLQKLRSKFFVGAAYQGHAEADIKEIWRQIASFSGYAFCKAHSASYAAESLQSLFLKAHFPLQFITAVIDCGGGFYPKECYVHEARRLGARVEPPCINRCAYGSVLIGDRILLGFKHVKSIRRDTLLRIFNARSAGRFMDFQDFLNRVVLPFGQLDGLIRLGVFRSFHRDLTILYRMALLVATPYRQQSLFTIDMGQPELPPIDMATSDDPSVHEIAMLGFALCRPFERLNSFNCVSIPASKMHHNRNKKVQIVGYFIVQKPVTTEHGQHMCFATWIDEHDDYFDTVHFPTTLERDGSLRSGFYHLRGMVKVEHTHAMLEVRQAIHLQSAE